MKIIRVDRDGHFKEKETPINVEGTDEQCFEKFYAENSHKSEAEIGQVLRTAKQALKLKRVVDKEK